MTGLSVNAVAMAFYVDSNDIEFGNPWWFVYASISCFLVLFAGIMSGLTLGLMSLGLVELEILQRSGTDVERKQAETIAPVVQKQHQLLVTLLLCNAVAMESFLRPGSLIASSKLNSKEIVYYYYHLPHYAYLRRTLKIAPIAVETLFPAGFPNFEIRPWMVQFVPTIDALPIYLDKLFHPVVAVILSVTFVLAFGEIIPQAVSSRYGLAVGANCMWLVRLLMIVCYPISYPIGKVLDYVLGHSDVLFRRPQLKALVSIHSQEAGRGGELTHDEATIISGALDLTEKTAEEAMTPIESTFSLDVNSKLDWEVIGKILARGYSRIPVFSGNRKNIIGLLLVKNLLTIRPETETPVSSVSIRRMPRVPANMPLYDILNEFQKGSSHMAAVVKMREREKEREKEKKLLISSNGHKVVGEKLYFNRDSRLTVPLLDKFNGHPKSAVIDIEKPQQNGFMTNGVDFDEGEVIGIITLEDVFEELLQEEIIDETDVYVDVHKRIRVVAAAAASSVARAPINRRITAQKPSSDVQVSRDQSQIRSKK
ncbi:DUF21 domain-containing protein [Orobanche gracilis]